MALGKKYAGLPDLDASQEIYETPGLTDDASTIHTDTVRTESPTPSEDGDERLVRDRIDQNIARQRFEPTIVNAKDANFSDTIASGERRSYRTKSRRRRRRGYDRDSGSESEEETISSKIARLKREAEEVKLALARQKSSSVGNSEAQTNAGQNQAGEDKENAESVEDLSRLVADLDAPASNRSRGKAEEDFLRSLSTTQPDSSQNEKAEGSSQTSAITPSTLTALAAFAERLTSLESALGLPSISSTDSPPPILPTLTKLDTQISTISTTLIPNTRSTSSQNTTPNLDALQTRIRALTIEADKLNSARKAALTSLSDLQEARLRFSQTRTRATDRDRPHSGTGPQPNIDKQEAAIHSELFLSEQSAKITALYQVLPSITELQPLLPVVLERLRSLSVIHAGAAEARGELDEVQRRQGETRAEVKRWREAVERTEKKMEEMKGEMKENVDVVGAMVRGCEERVKSLGGK